MSTALRTSTHRLTKYFFSFARFRANPSSISPACSLPARQLLPLDSQTRSFSTQKPRSQELVPTVQEHHDFQPSPSQDLPDDTRLNAIRKLPPACPGCGALSQVVDPSVPGHFDLSASRNSSFVGGTEKRRDTKSARTEEDEVFRETLERVGGLIPQPTNIKPTQHEHAKVPICDRCHMLRYQSQGQSIIHPSLQSIQAMIEESPHKHNHIYHVVDAADFPMSLVPNLTTALHLPRLRTQNRRSKHMRFLRGRTAQVSFIITRSDLLAPRKEQVDSLLPYLKDVLRDALGKTGKNLRLGNVRCVSAKRGWWTPVLKEEIWNRGGAGWMVGKVNVGKSALYETVFPKGRNDDLVVSLSRLRQAAKVQSGSTTLESSMAEQNETEELDRDRDVEGETAYELKDDTEDDVPVESFDEDSDALLPPVRTETAYPEMPTISSLPGTTASPIRIPYGNGKGELIDLPGIHRSSLDTHVKPEFHGSMIMQSRVVPETHTIKPGQSILLGGLIRITPKLQAATSDLIFLAYPFVPPAFAPHVTATSKAIGIQTGFLPALSEDEHVEAYSGTIQSTATDEAKQSIQSAGDFTLRWDATKKRAGPLTDKQAGKMKSDRLAFTVYSADILIEGVGWVELACQMRKRMTEDAVSGLDPAEMFPEVEIFSPEGKFVGLRRPMNGFLLGGPLKSKTQTRPRPRQTITMKKRQLSSQMARRAPRR